MKYYTLEAVVRGKQIKFDKIFSSRKSAIDYMFTYYDKHHMYNLMVNDEIAVNGNKHDIEYVCDNESYRFRVNRKTIC